MLFMDKSLLKRLIFVMSCFQFPVATCDDMRKAIANQWWGMEEGKRKLH
jgi:hypothetical protein